MSRTFFRYALVVSIFAEYSHCLLNPRCPTNVSTIQHLTLPFSSRSQAGLISIAIQPNNDTEHAFGLDLIYPGTALSELQGFPVLHGSITYPIPSSPYTGYDALFGWIQFVQDVSADGGGNWTMDVYPFAKDINTPFGYWGFNPSVFDAPAKPLADDGTAEKVAWTAQAFLCVLPDAGISKNVTVIPGAAITWGFDVSVEGKNSSERQIVVRKPETIEVKSEWPQRLPLLREMYPEWTFQDV